MTQPSTQPTTNPQVKPMTQPPSHPYDPRGQVGLGKKFDPTTDPDVQEALSVKYGSAALIIIPLKSGSIAIFDKSYNLHEIIADPSQGQFLMLAQFARLISIGRTSEARFYGEPDDQTYKKDRIKAHRLESRPDKPGLDVSDFEF
jgi:hypothetical protein